MRVDPDAPLQAAHMRGRTALVTGGGGRNTGPGTVGWAVSRLLARHGASVAVLDRDPQAARRTVSQIERAGGRAMGWQMTRHAIELMPSGGAIVNITSVAARRAGTVYGLGKAALESMTSGAAHLLGERGIRINSGQVLAVDGGGPPRAPYPGVGRTRATA